MSFLPRNFSRYIQSLESIVLNRGIIPLYFAIISGKLFGQFVLGNRKGFALGVTCTNDLF